MTDKNTCPNCGANDPWEDSRDRSKNKCKYCGREFEDGEAVLNKAVATEKKPEPMPKTPAQPVEQTSGASVLGSFLAIAAVMGLFIALFWWMVASINKDTRETATVNTIGQYTVYKPTCPAGSEGVAVEYGFSNEPPILSVYPNTENNRWNVTPEIADLLAEPMKSKYLWVHCINSENLPEYFNTHSPIPEDGMEVVFRR